MRKAATAHQPGETHTSRTQEAREAASGSGGQEGVGGSLSGRYRSARLGWLAARVQDEAPPGGGMEATSPQEQGAPHGEGFTVSPIL